MSFSFPPNVRVRATILSLLAVVTLQTVLPVLPRLPHLSISMAHSQEVAKVETLTLSEKCAAIYAVLHADDRISEEARKHEEEEFNDEGPIAGLWLTMLHRNGEMSAMISYGWSKVQELNPELRNASAPTIVEIEREVERIYRPSEETKPKKKKVKKKLKP